MIRERLPPVARNFEADRRVFVGTMGAVFKFLSCPKMSPKFEDYYILHPFVSWSQRDLVPTSLQGASGICPTICGSDDISLRTMGAQGSPR